MSMTQEQRVSAVAAEVAKLQKALEDSGVKASQKVVERGTVDFEVSKELEPESILESQPDSPTKWKIRLFSIDGVSAAYSKDTMPKGTYRLVATQSVKDKTKGGLSWVKVS